ncbi:uncharacterized protein LOC104583999 [Brachypodium distachyon]|uniref:uncharacterized protein LOC104583999 n=1 Tax=Brachypodium distachyon TaxID=15368 RepID=UPI00053004EC|nr:uncharacterized protein LOC104583999 [Brachypodium distachyon]|eukprot:XP_010236375.1 uncharacterized protein LOC104583999 [Brachypodium distachyon]
MEVFAHFLLENLVEMIGYEVAGRVMLYWLLPGKHLSDNALMLINKPEHSLEMWDSVQCGSRYLQTTRTSGIAKKKLSLEKSDSEGDSDSDYGAHLEDSDLDIRDGDDDLYDDNIDEDEDEVSVSSKKEKKDKKAENDEDQNSDKKGKAKLVDDEDEMVALHSDDDVVSWESEDEEDVKFNF